MPKKFTEIWVKLATGGKASRAKVPLDGDIEDLCTNLKDTTFKNALQFVDKNCLDVMSPDDSQELYMQDKKIRDLPTTTLHNPIIVTIAQLQSDAETSNLATTPPGQYAASAFSNDPVSVDGFGSLPSSFRIDATDHSAVHSALCPTETDIANVSSDMPLAGELMELIPREETKMNGVAAIVGKASVFSSIDNGRTTLKDINCGIGLATPQSYCDHLMMGGDKRPCGLIELKGGDISPLVCNRQAAAYGSHLAMGLINLGLPSDQIMVPLYTYNGMYIQFGVTIVLKPSFPVYWTISKLLDMADANERRIAVAYIQKANLWINQIRVPEKGTSPSFTAMQLNISTYHVKLLTNDICKRSFQLFSEIDDFTQGIEHWGRVLNRLYADQNVRPHVVFPLAIRSPDKSVDERYYQIIYKDLTVEGYRIGCPDRVKDPMLYNAYRDELFRIVGLVHNAGVIHCDLYLSNVMWKKRKADDDAVVIVIIDWDCAHCLIEGNFSRNVRKALKSKARLAEFGTSFDDQYIAVLDREYKPSESEYWAQLASNNKKDVDEAFYYFFERM